MDLYRTAKGEWHGTQADVTAANRREGSKAGTWRKVTVPDRKADRIAFLNRLCRAEEMSSPGPNPEKAPPPVIADKGGRYRVSGGLRERVFISTARADSPDDAVAQVAATLVAKPDPAFA